MNAIMSLHAPTRARQLPAGVSAAGARFAELAAIAVMAVAATTLMASAVNAHMNFDASACHAAATKVKTGL